MIRQDGKSLHENQAAVLRDQSRVTPLIGERRGKEVKDKKCVAVMNSYEVCIAFSTKTKKKGELKMKKRVFSLALVIILLIIASSTMADTPTTSSERQEWADFNQRSKESSPCPVRPPVAVIQDIIRGRNAEIRGIVTVVDGKFGPDTRSGVRKYQELYDLKTDGIVGPITWRCLCSGLLKYRTVNTSMATVRYYRLNPDVYPYSLSGVITRENGSGFRFWNYNGTSVNGHLY